MSNDVKILFPNRQRSKKTKRGSPPRVFIDAPSYEEMVNIAFKEVLHSEKQTKGDFNFYFFLLKKKTGIGYISLNEEVRHPITSGVSSYRDLQYHYDNIRNNAYWYKSVEDVAAMHTSRGNANRPNNEAFMKAIIEKFSKIPPAPPVTVIAPEITTVAPPPVPAPIVRQFTWGNVAATTGAYMPYYTITDGGWNGPTRR